MSDTSSPAQPPSREPTPSWCLAVSALGIAAVVLSALIAQQRAEAAHAHPQPPPGHSHTPTTTKPPICSPPNACYPPPTTTRRPTPTTTKRPAPATTRPPICSPPNACYPPPTTTKRPTPTTTKRPVTTTTKPPAPTTTKRPVTTTTRRPAPTTTKRPTPTTTKRPVTTTTKPPAPTTTKRPTPTTTKRPTPTTTKRPVTTTTRRPAPTTTKRPVTTTTKPPAPTTTQAAGGDPDCRSWACTEINAGIENGYLPDDYNPDEDTGAEDLRVIIERYGEHNPDFDADAALETLPEEGNAERGDMFIAIAIGIGLDVDPEADPFEVADELADMGILLGTDGDGDGIANPYTRPDADPDSTMTNSELAAFLDRIPTDDGDDGGGGGPRGGGPPDGGGGSPPGGGDDDEEPCTTGLGLTAGDRSRFVSQLRWVTLVGIQAQGEPGKPWPPHPDVPGGRKYLLVAGSPVWPVTDSGGVWHVVSDDGCLWEVISIQARLTQLLPWRPSHRAVIENAHTARPGAGFDTYLSRWDNLNASQQAQAQQHHTGRDVSASCGIETAMVSVDSYDRCRWELPAPGMWSWQARACFRGITEDTTFHQCATLARGVEWFLEIIDYTSGITLHHSAAVPLAEPRRPAQAA